MSKINKYNSLNDLEKKIRIAIMNIIIDEKSKVKVDSVKDILKIKFDISKDKLGFILENFVKNNIMVVDEDDYINFIYPVSAIETNHRVTLEDGRALSAMCAIDAIGVSCTFNQDIEINSKCSQTFEDINIKIKGRKIEYANPDTLRILHLNLDKYENWSANC